MSNPEYKKPGLSQVSLIFACVPFDYRFLLRLGLLNGRFKQVWNRSFL